MINKIIAKLKKAWEWFVNLCGDETFLYGFPFAALATISFFTDNPLAPVLLLIWMLVIIVNYGSK